MTSITFFLLIPILAMILLFIIFIFARHNPYQEKHSTKKIILKFWKKFINNLKKIPYDKIFLFLLIHFLYLYYFGEVYFCESDNDTDDEASTDSVNELEKLQAECDREKCLYDNAKERLKSAFLQEDGESATKASVEAGKYKDSYFSNLAKLNELETTLGYANTSSEITEQTGNTWIDKTGRSNDESSSDDDSSNNGDSDKVSLPDKSSNKGFVQNKK